LARIVVMEAALRLRPDIIKYGWKLALQAHDELVLIVPLDHVDYAKQRLREELTRQVTWMPDLPVACSVEAGPTYGDAK
jgi:DNA polymerase I-like protein with 3'-5' exonuclease and polymerase domains